MRWDTPLKKQPPNFTTMKTYTITGNDAIRIAERDGLTLRVSPENAQAWAKARDSYLVLDRDGNGSIAVCKTLYDEDGKKIVQSAPDPCDYMSPSALAREIAKENANLIYCTVVHSGYWTNGDGSGHAQYQHEDYFDWQGVYKGPDESGIEPTFADAPKEEDEEEVEPRVIFDNGGGITIQLPGFAHFYTGSCIDQAAQDWYEYLKSGTTVGWDGNEEEAAELAPTYDEIRNGGYRVMDRKEISDAVEAMRGGSEPEGWNNIDAFVTSLAELQDCAPDDSAGEELKTVQAIRGDFQGLTPEEINAAIKEGRA